MATKNGTKNPSTIANHGELRTPRPAAARTAPTGKKTTKNTMTISDLDDACAVRSRFPAPVCSTIRIR